MDKSRRKQNVHKEAIKGDDFLMFYQGISKILFKILFLSFFFFFFLHSKENTVEMKEAKIDDLTWSVLIFLSSRTLAERLIIKYDSSSENNRRSAIIRDTGNCPSLLCDSAAALIILNA